MLTGTFGRVAGSGKPEMVLITGYSGIGKSSLVHQLCKPVMREGGYFLSGKFEQRKHDIPELQPAIREGLLYSNQACHFAHDRVYEAAYLLMPASQRAEVHLRLGRLLLAHSSQASLDENVFDIVNQVRVRC